MEIQGLHHVSLIVTDLDRSKAFYGEVLGLKEIERPPFNFPGAWYAVGAGGQQLHLIVHNGETLRSGGIDTRDGHFAIRVRDYRLALERLCAMGIDHEARPDSITGFAQIFITDPDRNIVELNASL